MPTVDDLELFAGNDNVLKYSGLRDSDDAYQNAGILTATLYDAAGNEIAGQAWPADLDYVAGSNGDYEAVLQDALDVSPGQRIRVFLTIAAGGLSGAIDRWITIKKRES